MDANHIIKILKDDMEAILKSRKKIEIDIIKCGLY